MLEPVPEEGKTRQRELMALYELQGAQTSHEENKHLQGPASPNFAPQTLQDWQHAEPGQTILYSRKQEDRPHG